MTFFNHLRPVLAVLALAVAVSPAAAALTPPAPGKSPTIDAIRARGKIIAGNAFKFRLFNTRNGDTGEQEGFMVDIGKALAKQLLGDENLIEWHYAGGKDNFANIRFVIDGQVDVIIDCVGQGGYTGFKKSLVSFSDEIFPAGMALLVKKGSPIRSLDDIKPGTRVLLHEVFVDGGPLIQKKAPDAKYIKFDDWIDALDALKSGEGDVLPHNLPHLINLAGRDPEFEIVGRFSAKPFGIVSRKEDLELTKYLNEFLRDLKASGEYDRIFQRWFARFGTEWQKTDKVMMGAPETP
jgi:putative glutamine transport system substrate-binding protein